ncbi:MAG: DUF402 domain-containing protein [Gemmatimonadetes bacterium]|nr:DUF402 domain-containing protein [Gemmatimonadota bacterium]
MSRRLVHIHYLRPPDRTDVYLQELVHDAGDAKVTLARNRRLERPIRVVDRIILEAGSDAVWFTFPGAWHDIGRFHLADGTFTGVYANILVPCVFEPGEVWHTTDLFLDLWLPANGATTGGGPGDVGGPLLLDEKELAVAERRGWVDQGLAARARAEARQLLAESEAGRWPPPVVWDWPLERALEVSDRGGLGLRRGASL